MLRIILVLAASVMAQTYENKALNAKYVPPAGWVYEKTTSQGVDIITPNRVGLNPTFIEIVFERHQTSGEAYPTPPGYAFWQFTNFFKNTSASTKTPTVKSMNDTVIGAIHYAHIEAVQADLGLAIMIYAAANQTYSMHFAVVTSEQDYRVNGDKYFDNWLGMSFINLIGAPAKVAATRKPEAQIKRELADALGRRVGGDGVRAPQRRFR